MHTRILRLNLAGQPIDWLNWEEAVCIYARDLVVWTLGDTVRKVHGGICRRTGEQVGGGTAQHYRLWRRTAGQAALQLPPK